MRHSLVFFLLGLVLAVEAVVWRGYWWLLLWPAAACWTISLAYVLVTPAFFRKSAAGKLPWWVMAALGPYLAVSTLVWHVRRALNSQPGMHEVADGVWLSRRPLPHEIPADVDLVIDLTSEFPEPRGVMKGRKYMCIPTLDMATLPEKELLRAVQDAAAHPGRMLVHCAMGQGRSASFVAMLLIVRGIEPDAESAVARLKKMRPGVRLTTKQFAQLKRVVEEMRRQNAERANPAANPQ